MSIVIISKQTNLSEWKNELERLESGLEVSIYPEVESYGSIEFALAWKPPMGVFEKFPNLKCIASTGAGVDHIILDKTIPEFVRITRVVDKQLAKDMTAYLIAQVMNYIRDLIYYKGLQKDGIWERKTYRKPSEVRIGIMGMGELGQRAGSRFADLGFKVNGWAQTPKNLESITVFSGEEDFASFLSQSDILICLLPLTPITRHILNKDTFKRLPKNAFVINVARGEHLVEEDLLDALDSGQLSGACLDVFRTEPLPANHEFWRHPKITITPHVASITGVASVAPQIIENYRRMKKGEPLLNEVSRSRGY